MSDVKKIDEMIFAQHRAEIETRTAALAEQTRSKFAELGIELKDYSNRRFTNETRT